MHHLKFSQLPPHDKSAGGYRIKATKSNFPALQGMSLYQLVLQPRALREPHWHANADELGYCVAGQVLVSFYNTGDHREQFLISPGETFFIPSGALHAIENIGKETANLILQFSHQEPEDFGLSTSFGMFTDSVLGNAWNVPARHFDGVAHAKKDVFIAQLEKSTQTPESIRYQSPYQYNLDASFPVVANGGGNAKVARGNVWPVLQQQALYSLILTNTGMREPHWHPETAELGYIQAGQGRMSILSPDGSIDTYQMDKGDIYFIPKAYPHHIENLGDDDLHILIFFDQAMPRDVGFTASVKSFSNEALAAVLHSKPEVFETLPRYFKDLFIVKKVNS
jgi:oxalate decarboxylase